MSRGPGIVQRALLEVVSRAPGRAAGWIGWEVALQVDGLDAEGLQRSFYSAFRRALALLTDPGHGELTVTRRPYRSLDEVVEEYPFRSRSLQKRDDRLELLPRFSEYVRMNGPRYSKLGVERHVLLSTRPAVGAPADQFAAWGRARTSWASLDRRVLDAIHGASVESTALLVDALVKGREYFLARSSYQLDRPFWDIVAALRTKSPADRTLSALIDEMATLLETWVPRRETARGSLKSQLYAIVDLGIHRAVSLHERVWEYLRSTCQSMLERRFGDRPPVQPRGRFFREAKPLRLQRVDGAIHRDVLWEELFLRRRD